MRKFLSAAVIASSMSFAAVAVAAPAKGADAAKSSKKPSKKSSKKSAKADPGQDLAQKAAANILNGGDGKSPKSK